MTRAIVENFHLDFWIHMNDIANQKRKERFCNLAHFMYHMATNLHIFQKIMMHKS